MQRGKSDSHLKKKCKNRYSTNIANKGEIVGNAKEGKRKGNNNCRKEEFKSNMTYSNVHLFT